MTTRRLLARGLIATGVTLLVGALTMAVHLFSAPRTAPSVVPPAGGPSLAAFPAASLPETPVFIAGQVGQVVSSSGAGGQAGHFPAAPAGDADRRAAITHWNAGIIYFQKGDYTKAQDEWALCKQLDPSNSDCTTGLRRMEQAGVGPRAP